MGTAYDFRHTRVYRGPLRAAILDWAGTTVDFGSTAPALAFMEAFRREGVEITLAEARGPMGTHKRTHIAQIGRDHAVAERWEEAHGAPFGDADIDRIYEAFVPLQMACLVADGIWDVPGVIDDIEARLARGERP